MSYHLFKSFGWSLCIYEYRKNLNFPHFPHYVILMFEQEGKSYITYYQIKIHSVLIDINSTVHVDMLDHFRSKFSRFMLVIRSTISQKMQNRGVQCEKENYHFSFLIYRQMCKIFNPLSSMSMFITGTLLPCNDTWWLEWTILFDLMWHSLTVTIIAW